MIEQKYIIHISGHAKREGEYWSAFCNELPVASAGLTRDEAIKNAMNAAIGYIRAVEDAGERDALVQRSDIVADQIETRQDEEFQLLVPA